MRSEIIEQLLNMSAPFRRDTDHFDHICQDVLTTNKLFEEHGLPPDYAEWIDNPASYIEWLNEVRQVVFPYSNPDHQMIHAMVWSGPDEDLHTYGVIYYHDRSGRKGLRVQPDQWLMLMNRTRKSDSYALPTGPNKTIHLFQLAA